MSRNVLNWILVLALAACHTTTTRTNNQKDIRRGMDVAEEFYREVKAGQFEDAMSFISEAKFDHDDALKLLTTIRSMQGSLDSVQTTSANSWFKVTDGDTMENHSVQLKCFYTQGTSKEELVIERENGALKITAYQFSF